MLSIGATSNHKLYKTPMKLGEKCGGIKVGINFVNVRENTSSRILKIKVSSMI